MLATSARAGFERLGARRDLERLDAPRKAELDELTARELESRLRGDNSFAWIARQLPLEVSAEVKKLQLPGIYFLESRRRSYPRATLAANIIGYTARTDRYGDTRIVGRDSHTEGKDLVELTKQFTKWSAEVHRSDRIPEFLNRAFKVAATPPTGPVYLSLPSNLLGENIDQQNPVAERSRITPRIAADPEALQKAARMLASANRPLIVAGSGIASAPAIEQLEIGGHLPEA